MEWKIYRRWKVFLAQIFDFENDFPLNEIFFPPSSLSLSFFSVNRLQQSYLIEQKKKWVRNGGKKYSIENKKNPLEGICDDIYLK